MKGNTKYSEHGLMIKRNLIWILLFLVKSLLAQPEYFDSTIWSNLKKAKLISFCECIHGSDELLSSQIQLIEEINSLTPLDKIFIEENNIYAEKSKIARWVNEKDSTVEIIGYNPGFLYSSYQKTKKELAYFDSFALVETVKILNRIDTDEAYFWYRLSQSEYDQIQQKLSQINASVVLKKGRKYIRQLQFDLKYLQLQRIYGDKIRDSLMFEWIVENCDSGDNKIVILGHCGHLAKSNPYLPRNLGYFLVQKYGNSLLTIGSDSRSISVNTNEKKAKYSKKALKINGQTSELLYIPTNYLTKKQYPVFLVGSNYILNQKHRLSYRENYDLLFYLDQITVKRMTAIKN